MSEAFLVYRPVMDYEESMTPHFICLSKSEAERCVDVMRAHMDDLLSRLPEYPEEDGSGKSDEKLWNEVDAQRKEILSKVEWPYGVSLVYEIHFGRNEWDRGCLDVMKVPIVKP